MHVHRKKPRKDTLREKLTEIPEGIAESIEAERTVSRKEVDPLATEEEKLAAKRTEMPCPRRREIFQY